MPSGEAAEAVPATQKIAILEDPKPNGRVVIKEAPVLEPGPDEVLVKVVMSGVCHSDLHFVEGDLPFAVPCIGGHEGAGCVVKVGSHVDPTVCKVGERVGVKWQAYGCGVCEFCLTGRENQCLQLKMSGFTAPGSFQQYCVAKALHVGKIPDGVSYEDAAPIMCAGATVLAGLRRTDTRAGQWMAIPGAGGGLGHLAVQYAKAMGLKVIAIDGGPEKEKLCKELGADVFIDFTTSKDVVADVIAASDGQGVHGAIVVAASEGPYKQAANYLRRYGTLVCVGLPKNANFTAPVGQIAGRCLTIRGSLVGTRSDTHDALAFVAAGKVKPIVKVEPFDSLNDVYDRMRANLIAGRIVLDLFK
ncbi:alcohol dehydrogenase 1 [Hyaloraphidium curvatum]|nr:alcohol dehydrogenase 1 [Hyaloraphidium curvatum]